MTSDPWAQDSVKTMSISADGSSRHIIRWSETFALLWEDPFRFQMRPSTRHCRRLLKAMRDGGSGSSPDTTPQAQSEIYTTLNQKPPVNGAAIDLSTWRDGIGRKVIEWSNSAPATTAPSTQLAPADIFSAILHIDLVLLYYPSASFPDPSQNDILIIAQSASECISNYRRAFRDGRLRFFWRTTHNLFRSGVAMAYCVHLNSIQHYPDLSQVDMITSVNTCMSILWAMVERYPAGSVYRDAYESLSSSVLRQAAETSNVGDVQCQGESQLAFDTSFWADMASPQTSLGTLYWGSGNAPWI